MKTSILLLAAFLFIITPIVSWGQNPNEFTLDEVYRIDHNGGIFVDTHDAEIKVIGSARDDIHVKIHRKSTFTGLNIKAKKQDLTVDVKEQNGNLYLKDSNYASSWTGIGSHHTVYEILIEGPHTAGLFATGDDDNYLIKDIDGTISMEISDGDIVLESCGGDKFDFTLDDADITMDQGRGSVQARLQDGTIEIESGNFEKVDIKVDDGNIRLATKLHDAGDYLLGTEDGSIHFQVESGGGQFNILHDDGHVRASNGFQLLSDSESRSKYQLSGGNAIITIETEDGRVALLQE